jgi:hypothetical protein
MKRENSIKLLTEQKDKLYDKSLDEHHWTDETLNIISNIFGRDTDQFRQIKDLSISIDNNVYNGGNNNPLRNRERAAKYIDSYIKQVENFTYEKIGTFNSDNEYKFSKSIFYTIATTLIGGSFALGFYFGNNKFDNEKIELVDKIHSLSSDTTKLNLHLKEKTDLLKLKDSILQYDFQKPKQIK